MINADPDWAAFRARFPLLEKKTYLNSCSYGVLSVEVSAALEQYLLDRHENGSDWENWVTRNERVRDAVARLLGAQSDEIAITASASAGINAIASALRFDTPRNKVVISDFEFPTSGQIWYAQELRGAEVVLVPERDGYIPVEDFEAAIDENTLIVAAAKVCYRNGARLDISAIAEIARKNGALFLVDSYQGMGTMAFDVNETGVDFVTGGMLKYLLGSAGIGFLFARKSLIEATVPTSTGWFAQANIFAMDHTVYDPSPTARRFEMGTPPVPSCYTAEAGLSMIDEVGLPAIGRRIGELTAMIKAEAKKAGYSVATPESPERHGPMIAIRSHDEHGLVAELENEGIVTSCRAGNLRISPHCYNKEEDIEMLFRALRKHNNLLA